MRGEEEEEGVEDGEGEEEANRRVRKGTPTSSFKLLLSFPIMISRSFLFLCFFVSLFLSFLLSSAMNVSLAHRINSTTQHPIKSY